MQLIRETYRPGKDVLAYAAVDVNATNVVARVYGPGQKHCQTHRLRKLEQGVFALDFCFEELGNYIFVVAEDGEVKTILNAKVYA